MGLIPLPNEQADNEKEVKQKLSRDEKIIADTCYKLVRYVKNDKIGVGELEKLIEDMQRSVLSMQRRKMKALERKHLKKRKFGI